MIILYWEREINHERHPAVAGLTGELARHEKEQIHFILQAREHEVNEVKPGNAALRSGFRISPLATNPATAVPLDHARRAARGRKDSSPLHHEAHEVKPMERRSSDRLYFK